MRPLIYHHVSCLCFSWEIEILIYVASWNQISALSSNEWVEFAIIIDWTTHCKPFEPICIDIEIRDCCLIVISLLQLEPLSTDWRVPYGVPILIRIPHCFEVTKILWITFYHIVILIKVLRIL